MPPLALIHKALISQNYNATPGINTQDINFSEL